MKAIVNVRKRSFYSKYNGLTFEVSQFLSNIVALDIHGQTTADFRFNEVLIVDVDKELSKAWTTDIKAYNNLKAYCEVNKIDLALA